MTSSQLFTEHNVEEQAQALADFLPNGCLFEAKNRRDSLYRQFLRGLGAANFEPEAFLRFFSAEIDLNTTTALLEEWEATVGIPDDCFSTNTDIETRRQQVLIKLAALGVQTEEDFENLAALYGVTIEIQQGTDVSTFPLIFPSIFFGSSKEARFSIVVLYEVALTDTFTYTFPIPFGDAAIPILECLFDKLAPANVQVIFRQVDQIDPFLEDAFDLGFDEGFS